MKKTLLLLTFLLSLSYLFSQTEILHIETENDTTPPRFGPNRTHFVHTYFSFGWMLEVPSSGNYHFPASTRSAFGILYKRRFGNYFSAGVDLNFGTQNIRLSKDRNTVFPDTIIHSKEQFRTGGINGNLFIRFNFKKRGNSMGQFLDLGVGGALYTSRTYIYEDPLQGKEWQEVRIKNHRAILQYNSYLLGRLGVNNFSLGVRYRITPFFSENSNYPAAPPILIDFTWGFF